MTAAIINKIPKPLVGVIFSPNTKIPKISAVNGSNAPSIDTGIEPMSCIAIVIVTKEIIVGKTDNPIKHNHGTSSGCMESISVKKSSFTTNTDRPNNNA